MSFLSSKSFIFNDINSEDFNVVIAWINEPDVVSNGLTKEIKKRRCICLFKPYFIF